MIAAAHSTGGRSRAALALLLTGVVALLAAGPVAAQAPPQVTAPPGEVPGLPEGDARLTGRVVHPDGAAPAADLPVALYALRPDGRPGLGGTRTDAEGRFVFEGISGEAGVVYLIGTQFEDVPFGQRIFFEPGQKDVDVELPIRPISQDASALLVIGTRYKLDWVGSRLFVQVSHQLRNPTPLVIAYPEDRRAGAEPPFSALLPGEVLEFVDGQSGLGEGVDRDGERLAYWGPIYPGDQEVRYGFLLAGPESPEDPDAPARLSLPVELPEGTGVFEVLTRAAEPRPSAEGLRDTGEVMDLEGVDYARSSAGGLAPGQALEVEIELPASSSDPSALRVTRADYWIDHDDTAMRITAEIQLDVGSSVRLLAGDEPLLHFPLQEGAEFMGLSEAGQAIGMTAGADGGLDVRGPLPPGPSALGFRYRIPIREGSAELDLVFDRPVDLLNVLVADTGIVVENDRLHRRRPFKQGTRVYLHREAYQLAAGESVDIRLSPFERGTWSRAATTGLALLLAAGLAVFLIAPLRGRREEPEDAEEGPTELALEREYVYETLRDIDHDHETGKLDDADYTRIRAELRAEAVELMRRERGAPAAAPAPAEATEPEPTADEPTCPSCGGVIDPSWKFCSHCGATLQAVDRSA